MSDSAINPPVDIIPDELPKIMNSKSTIYGIAIGKDMADLLQLFYKGLINSANSQNSG